MAEPTLKDILNALVVLTGAIGRLEKGQAALEKGQAALEKGQAALEKGQAAFEKGQAALEKGQAALEKGQAALDAKIDTMRDELRSELRSAIRDFRAETEARFDALDEKLDTFKGVIARAKEDARDVRADVDAIHKGLVRADVPYIPQDLPSQVHAKGPTPKRTARRR